MDGTSLKLEIQVLEVLFKTVNFHWPDVTWKQRIEGMVRNHGASCLVKSLQIWPRTVLGMLSAKMSISTLAINFLFLIGALYSLRQAKECGCMIVAMRHKVGIHTMTSQNEEANLS